MWQIIAQKNEFFKTNFVPILLKFFWLILLIIIVICSFLLGRITKFLEMQPSFTFESKEDEDKNYEQEKNSLFGKISTSTIVASRGGKKYYFVWCSGAGNIKESNKRYFTTETLAQKAGYTLANNCK